MRIVFLFFLAVFGIMAQGVTGVDVDAVSYSSWRMKLYTNGSYNAVRLLYSVAPTGCQTAGASGVSQDAQMYNAALADAANQYILTSGKTPNTIYNACPQIEVNGTWYGGFTVQVRTKSAPGGQFLQPVHAQTVDTSYPADIVNNATDVTSVSVLNGCSDLYTKFGQAVAAQLNTNTIINIPVGQANGCTGTLKFDQTPPDAVKIFSSAVNLSDSSITLAQWNNNTPLVEGQEVVFAQDDSYYGGYNGLLPAGIWHDGRPYYLHLKTATSFYIYDHPFAQGGNQVILTSAGGPDHFWIHPIPRQLKWIFLRTQTPDDQFADPHAPLGGLQWLPEMAYFTNPVSNHNAGDGIAGNTVLFGTGDGNFQSQLANLRFIGIAWTMADDPASYTTSDPMSWPNDVQIAPTMTNLIFDRCAFFTPSRQQRRHEVISLNGMNIAFVNSYFDSTLGYFHGFNTVGIHQ